MKKKIALIGGMGPFAGMDVLNKIHENRGARADKEHPDVLYFSMPQGLPDRSEFLSGKTQINPGKVLAKKLSKYSFTRVGIACNTFHAPPIFNAFVKKVSERQDKVKVVHLIREVGKYIGGNIPRGTKIAVLSTEGTWRAKTYQKMLGDAYRLIYADKSGRAAVHQAIYDLDRGIKSRGRLSPESQKLLQHEIERLQKHRPAAFLLACTELPLGAEGLDFDGALVIDPNQILADALAFGCYDIQIE